MRVNVEICEEPLPANHFSEQWFQRLNITVDGRVEFNVFITAPSKEEVVKKAKEICSNVEWRAFNSVH